MLLLAVDTAGPACAVALLHEVAGNALIIASMTEVIGRGHAERLIPMIEVLMAESGKALADLGRIAVTTGPGSFTGIRVGVAAARGLALALDIPAVGVGSLEALVLPVAGELEGGTVAGVLDARRGEVFAYVLDIESGAPLVDAASLPPRDLAVRLKQARKPMTLVGNGSSMLASQLGDSQVRIASAPDFPDISDVARLGAIPEFGNPPPVPRYGRGADAKPQVGRVLAHR
jgi:tRNA threonylcarbamoyladenosine biosynthesis protein TsaB